jgi:hypothetical protein
LRDAVVFCTDTEDGIANTTLRVNRGTLDNQGLILVEVYHDNTCGQHGW